MSPSRSPPPALPHSQFSTRLSGCPCGWPPMDPPPSSLPGDPGLTPGCSSRPWLPLTLCGKKALEETVKPAEQTCSDRRNIWCKHLLHQVGATSAVDCPGQLAARFPGIHKHVGLLASRVCCCCCCAVLLDGHYLLL